MGVLVLDLTPLPRVVTLDAPTVLALSEADAALDHNQGLRYLITDPQLLVGPYVTREALASSRIEGTQTSLAEVLRANAGADTAAATAAMCSRLRRTSQLRIGDSTSSKICR